MATRIISEERRRLEATGAKIAAPAADIAYINDPLLSGALLLGFRTSHVNRPPIVRRQTLGSPWPRLGNPSHAGPYPGHCSLYSPADEAVFCGDVLFAGSVGRTTFLAVRGTIGQQLSDTLIALPDATRVFPATDPRRPSGANGVRIGLFAARSKAAPTQLRRLPNNFRSKNPRNSRFLFRRIRRHCHYWACKRCTRYRIR
jgi:glyoxylase-like metal-dependent hydrolase (beta-lactamase superfamily II)